MRNSKNLHAHELIGLRALIPKSNDKTIINLEGEIIGETQKTLGIRVNNETKIISKKIASFEFTLPGGNNVHMEGLKVLGRPEDRVIRLNDR